MHLREAITWVQPHSILNLASLYNSALAHLCSCIQTCVSCLLDVPEANPVFNQEHDKRRKSHLFQPNIVTDRNTPAQMLPVARNKPISDLSLVGQRNLLSLRLQLLLRLECLCLALHLWHLGLLRVLELLRGLLLLLQDLLLQLLLRSLLLLQDLLLRSLLLQLLLALVSTLHVTNLAALVSALDIADATLAGALDVLEALLLTLPCTLDVLCTLVSALHVADTALARALDILQLAALEALLLALEGTLDVLRTLETTLDIVELAALHVANTTLARTLDVLKTRLHLRNLLNTTSGDESSSSSDNSESVLHDTRAAQGTHKKEGDECKRVAWQSELEASSSSAKMRIAGNCGRLVISIRIVTLALR